MQVLSLGSTIKSVPPENQSNPPLPRWKKCLKRGAILLVGGAFLGLLLLNLFLATPIGRGWVAKKLSGAMRMPVTVGSASYTPWGGVRLKDLRVEQVAAARGIVSDPFFQAASFEADLRLLSLLSDEVVVKRLVCDSPKISLVHGQDVLVRRPAGAVPGEESPRPEGETGTGEPPAGSMPAPTSRPAPQPAKRKQRTLALGEVEIRGGEATVYSFEGEEMLRLEGLRMAFDFSGNGNAGSLNLDRVLLLRTLEVRELVSPLEVEGRTMKLGSLRAQCEGGEIRGELSFERRLSGTPFIAQLSAQGIEVAKILQGKSLRLTSGKVACEVALRGIAQSLKSIEGGGELHLESAVVEPGAEFEKLRSALDVDAAGKVKLDTAEASFAISRGVLGLREASFGSGRVLVKSVGGVRMDGALNVATRLYLGADLYSAIRSKPVPGRVALEFVRLDGTDWYFRDELVTGTVSEPKLDFWRTGTPMPAAEVMRELSFDFESPPGDAIGKGR